MCVLTTLGPRQKSSCDATPRGSHKNCLRCLSEEQFSAWLNVNVHLCSRLSVIQTYTPEPPPTTLSEQGGA